MTACSETTDGKFKLAGTLLRRFRTDETGATAIEYSLIVSLIFLAVVAAVRGMSDETTTMYGEIEGAMSGSTE